MFTKFWQPLLWLTCGLALLGCAAVVPKPQLYLMASTSAQQQVVSGSAAACGPIRVSVQLPAYLERDGLVLQVNDNELVAANDHLWAEPLVYGVERLLTRCLNPVTPAAGRATADAAEPLGLKVVIEQLHGTDRGESRLQASFSHAGAPGDAAIRYPGFAAQAQQAQPGYDALVTTQRGLLLDLCEQMAAQLPRCDS